MNEFTTILFENHSLIFTMSILWGILGFGFLYWRRKRRGLVIPNKNDADVKFIERFSSGFSNKSWVTRMGGAANCLTVILTDTHFVTTSFFPFNLFAGIYDLEHLVPISKIIDVVSKGKYTEIKFKREDGRVCHLSVQLKNTVGFLDALYSK